MRLTNLKPSVVLFLSSITIAGLSGCGGGGSGDTIHSVISDGVLLCYNDGVFIVDRSSRHEETGNQ